MVGQHADVIERLVSFFLRENVYVNNLIERDLALDVAAILLI